MDCYPIYQGLSMAWDRSFKMIALETMIPNKRLARVIIQWFRGQYYQVVPPARFKQYRQEMCREKPHGSALVSTSNQLAESRPPPPPPPNPAEGKYSLFSRSLSLSHPTAEHCILTKAPSFGQPNMPKFGSKSRYLQSISSFKIKLLAIQFGI